MRVLRVRRCGRCDAPIARVRDLDGVLVVEVWAGRRGDPLAAFAKGATRVVDDPDRNLWHKLDGVELVRCRRGHVTTVSMTRELRAVGVEPRELDLPDGFAEALARAILKARRDAGLD